MAILGQFAYMLTILAVGVGARRVDILDERRTAHLTAFAFYVALPALVFESTHDTRLRELVSPALLGGFWLVVGLTLVTGWLVYSRRTETGRSSVALIQSYHSNMGFLGLPIVAATFGGETTAIASIILGIGAVTQTPLSVTILSRLNGTSVSLRSELWDLLTNPVLIALGAGIAVSLTSSTPPSGVTTALEAIGSIALPVALLCVGASLDTDIELSALGETGHVVAMKLLLMPALAWLIYSTLDVGPETLTAGVMMVGAPTAVVTYIYTGELGGDVSFASRNVFATTLVSLVTLSALAWLLG